MKPDKQRTEIAKACGWTVEQNNHWHSPLGNDKAFWYENELPNYLNDLNAMHDAEKSLTEKQWKKYPVWLAKVIAGTQNKSRANGTRIYVPQSCLLAANAPQKAEAFLRTIVKWEE